MFFHGFREYEDVVKVHTDDTFHDQVLKDLVHHCLKCGGTICETKEHYQGFEEPTACSECSLPLIAFLHVNILITPSNIQLCENLRTAKLIDKVRDEWEGVAILNCHCIECTIILDEAKATILLLDEEDWRCHW